MLLIADSGSTKIDWRAIENEGTVKEITTPGINPYYQSEEQIVEEFKRNLLPAISGKVDEIHFYGAGVTPEKTGSLCDCFKKIFPGVEVSAYTDLLAAARALCGHKPGIAAILGTGGNSCFYDGEAIADNVPACGFILGDEGSGAVIGKKFLSDYLKRQIPQDIRKKFDDQFGLNYGAIVEKVYRQPYPNRFLASFSPFIYENKSNPYINQLLRQSFEDFITRNIMQYDYKLYPLNIVGSVAYYYADEIRKVASEHGIKTGKILKSPIEGLVEYHLTK
ncbi:MAG: ATPase [Rikenellaceae bacterium]|nr:ATPase [Rikenellaceae bacterium]